MDLAMDFVPLHVQMVVKTGAKAAKGVAKTVVKVAVLVIVQEPVPVDADRDVRMPV